jgi:hypothetical protein
LASRPQSSGRRLYGKEGVDRSDPDRGHRTTRHCGRRIGDWRRGTDQRRRSESKASGQITQMPVETGTLVKPGDLIVQLDTRDVKNQYDQSLADVRAAEAKLQVSESQKKRTDDLFKSRIITAQEQETSVLDFANAQARWFALARISISPSSVSRTRPSVPRSPARSSRRRCRSDR